MEAENIIKELEERSSEVYLLIQAVASVEFTPISDGLNEADERMNVGCLDAWCSAIRRIEGICTSTCALMFSEYAILGGYGGFFGEKKPHGYVRSRYGSVIRVRELLVAAGAKLMRAYEESKNAAITRDQAAASLPPIAPPNQSTPSIAFGTTAIPTAPTPSVAIGSEGSYASRHQDFPPAPPIEALGTQAVLANLHASAAASPFPQTQQVPTQQGTSVIGSKVESQGVPATATPPDAKLEEVKGEVPLDFNRPWWSNPQGSPSYQLHRPLPRQPHR